MLLRIAWNCFRVETSCSIKRLLEDEELCCSTKCCWVIHGSLTSERKASTSPSSFINHSTLLLNLALTFLKRQAPCLFALRSSSARQAQTQSESEIVDTYVGSARRRGNHMHDHSRFQRDINDDTGVSLSLPLTKVTDAQYRKRFRASYNTANFEAADLQQVVSSSYHS